MTDLEPQASPRSSSRRRWARPPGPRATPCSTPAGASPTGWPRCPVRAPRGHAFALAEATAHGDGPTARRPRPRPASPIASAPTWRPVAAGSDGADLLAEAKAYGVDELGFDPDAWVDELVRGTLGAGYPTPPGCSRHIEAVLERYLVAWSAPTPSPPGTYRCSPPRAGGGHGLRVQHAAGEPAPRARRRHRPGHPDLHPLPPDPRARGLRAPGGRDPRGPRRPSSASRITPSSGWPTRRSRRSSSSTRATPTAGPSATSGSASSTTSWSSAAPTW